MDGGYCAYSHKVGRSYIWKLDTIPTHLEQLHFITHNSHYQSLHGNLIVNSARSTPTSPLVRIRLSSWLQKNYSLTLWYPHIRSKYQENWKEPTIPASHSYDTGRIKLHPRDVFVPCLRTKQNYQGRGNKRLLSRKSCPWYWDPHWPQWRCRNVLRKLS